MLQDPKLLLLRPVGLKVISRVTLAVETRASGESGAGEVGRGVFEMTLSMLRSDYVGKGTCKVNPILRDIQVVGKLRQVTS